ncbi:MAG: hypothetical protein ACI8RD_007651 [Bacillariaceae sp.]|jgi:hypothetical protein
MNKINNSMGCEEEGRINKSNQKVWKLKGKSTKKEVIHE